MPTFERTPEQLRELLKGGIETQEERDALDLVIDQRFDDEDEITCPKKHWYKFGIHLQEMVPFDVYELCEPPEDGKRGQYVIARRKHK